MSLSDGSLERRRFLKRGAVFGLSAAALAQTGWTAPTMASFQPPAALGGSERLTFRGPGEMRISRKDVHEPGRFTLIGVELFGSWKLDIVPPPKTVTGLDLVVTMRPETVGFNGGESEVHDVFVNWMVTGKASPVSADLPWQLEASPADAESSPITAVHSCMLKLDLA